MYEWNCHRIRNMNQKCWTTLKLEVIWRMNSACTNMPSYTSHLRQTLSNLFRCCSSESIKWKQSADYKINWNEVKLTVLVSEIVANENIHFRCLKNLNSSQQWQGLCNRFDLIWLLNGHVILRLRLVGMWQPLSSRARVKLLCRVKFQRNLRKTEY